MATESMATEMEAMEMETEAMETAVTEVNRVSLLLLIKDEHEHSRNLVFRREPYSVRSCNFV